jgi:hypothetical protein
MNRIAIYIEGGMVQAVRSDISENLDVEIIDADLINEEGENMAEERWEELQEELQFGNY